jgi:hypothetical protein
VVNRSSGFSSTWVGRKAHDNSVENTFAQPEKETQISPLRFASVEMTSSWENRSDRSGRDDKVVETSMDSTLEITTTLSSRPERTRISYFADLNNGHVCGSLQRETHELDRSHESRQEIRGSAVEGPAVLPRYRFSRRYFCPLLADQKSRPGTAPKRSIQNQVSDRHARALLLASDQS